MLKSTFKLSPWLDAHRAVLNKETLKEFAQYLRAETLAAKADFKAANEKALALRRSQTWLQLRYNEAFWSAREARKTAQQKLHVLVPASKLAESYLQPNNRRLRVKSADLALYLVGRGSRMTVMRLVHGKAGPNAFLERRQEASITLDQADTARNILQWKDCALFPPVVWENVITPNDLQSAKDKLFSRIKRQVTMSEQELFILKAAFGK